MRRGFTLVELLIILAIIAVLAGLLFPVLAQVRTGAHKSVCLSNERQLGSALLLYAQDYDERLPDFHSDPLSAAHADDSAYWHDRFCRCLSRKPGERSFVADLEPYLRSPSVAFCPSDGDREAGGRNVTSYESKLWLAQGRTLVESPRPSEMAALWEQWGYHVGDGHASEYERRAALNVVFLDGHAKWKRLSEATSAKYGSGPNLHGLFSPTPPDDPLIGVDFVN